MYKINYYFSDINKVQSLMFYDVFWTKKIFFFNLKIYFYMEGVN